MDFPLNGTFIVQTINFFIVYFVLEHMFFKPILAQIRNDEEEHTILVERAQNARYKTEELQQQTAQHWQQCLQHVNALRPLIFAYNPPLLTSISLVEPTLAQKNVNDIVAHLRMRLEKVC